MVKFAKHLALEVVPEWKDAYVSYKKLKKDIKKIPPVRQRSFRGSNASVHRESDQDSAMASQRTARRRSSGTIRGGLLHRSRSRGRFQADRDYITVRTVRGDASDGSQDLYYTDVLPPFNEAPEEVAFFARMDGQLNKVNSFYCKKEQEYTARFQHLERQILALNEMKDALTKKGEQLAEEASPSPPSPQGCPLRSGRPEHAFDRDGPVPNRGCSGRDTSGDGDARQVDDTGVPEDAKDEGRGEHLDGENQSQEEAAFSAENEMSAPAVGGVRLVIPASTPVLALNKMSRKLWEDVAHSGPRAERLLARLSPDVPEILKQSSSNIKKAERLLYSATVEFYRGLGLLKSFSSLNMVAFGKILKKHDKVVGWPAARVYLAAVEKAHFQASPAVLHMMAATEQLFAKNFAHNSHKEAMQVLRPVHRSASHKVTFALGLFSGCILALLATLIVLLVNGGGFDHQGGPGYLTSVFPVFTPLLLLLLPMYLYGCNVHLWRVKQVNYPFIFEFRPGTELRAREVLLAATLLTSLTLGAMVLHLVLHTPSAKPGADDYIPLVVLLVWLAMFLCPFDLFWRSSRVFLLRVLRHLVLAPLYRVQLADFFVGDQLTSQIPFLQQMQYCCCYYFGGHFRSRDSAACTANGTYRSMLYVVAILPYWFRFAQCWRRYFEEGRDRVHLANAGKYFSAMLAVTFRLWYLNALTTPSLVLSIIAAVMATCYQCYWDLVMDWGLLRPSARNPCLRDQLLLKHRSIYFVAMVANLVLRLAWIQSLSRFRFGRVPASVMTLLVASLEVVRRGIWNFFRLENEHLNNVGRFRAVRSIPLPFKDLEGAEV